MRQLQDRVQTTVEELGLQTEPVYHLLDAMSELGEVSKELLKMTDYGKKRDDLDLEDLETVEGVNTLAEELGDLLFSVITVANSFSIDLQTQLHKVLQKYQQRFEEQGSVGSGN